MNDLRSKIIEKQGILDDLEIKQMNLAPDMADTELRVEVNRLEEEMSNMIDAKTVVIQQIEEYRARLHSVYSWFDSIIKQLEKCDKISNQDSKRKIEEIQELWKKFKDARAQIDDLKMRAAEIAVELSSLDCQQVEEQLRSVEKKYTDLHKRVGKKMQVIEMTRKGYDDAKKEVVKLQEWVNEKIEYMKDLPPLGFKTKDIEVRLLEINVSISF